MGAANMFAARFTPTRSRALISGYSARWPASFITSAPEHADLYFHEIGFRWSQRVAEGEVIRRTRHGREKVRTLWSRVPPALQLPQVFRAAVGREMRRTRISGISIKSAIAVFG